MEYIGRPGLLSWQGVVVTAVAYFFTRAFYNLFLHPLSQFPGPKLAAITRLYEAYYDVVKDGQYTFQIEKLHKQYGPIIRISPYELHFCDPSFYDTIYTRDGHWDKYLWAVKGFGSPGATMFTADHNIHKARRLPLSPFFSKSKVTSQQDVIEKHLAKFCHRISQFAATDATFNLGAAITAITRDIAEDFVIGKCSNSLDRDDFGTARAVTNKITGRLWRLSKHIPFIVPLIKAIPFDWVLKMSDKNTKSFFQYLQEVIEHVKHIMAEVEASPPSIVRQIMESSLPPSEKTFDRVFEDVLVIAGAGFETSAGVLRLVFFHVFSDEDILRRLRTELSLANTGSSQSKLMKLKTLEQLPYLTAVLKEGLRLSPGVASRESRVAPDRDILYGDWRIPAGTAVGATTLLIHTDETIYPEPRRFNPDRWLGSDKDKAKRAFAPFSKGTRNCLGMHLAWAELYLIVSVAVQSFNFQFYGASAEDYLCNSDEFTLGTKANGVLESTATIHNA